VNDWLFNDDEVQRAQALLHLLLPVYLSREMVVDLLWYDNPNASPEVRTMVIAAAVHVLLRSH